MKIWLPTIRAGSGSDVFARRLCAGLMRAGHEPVLQWFAHRYELMPWRLRAIAPPPGTQIVHAGTWQGFAFRRPGLPLVLTEHQYVGHPALLACRGWLQGKYHDLAVRRWVRRSYAAADAVACVSRTVAEAAQRDHPRCRIEVIHNWLDVRGYCPEPLPAEAHAPFRVLFVGNPSRHKGADLVVPLARALGADFELWSVGGLRVQARRGGLPANVRALDSVAPDAMPALYAQADAVVVLARYESFGYVALEAMACGRPVAGFDNTGTAEVCAADETALLVPTGDVMALAAQLRRLASSPALRRELGAAGRARALARFDEAAAIGAYTALYSSLLEKQS